MTENYRFKAIEDDIKDLKAWKDDTVEPHIKEGEALKNQIKGARTLLWVIIVLLGYLAGDRAWTHIDFGKLVSMINQITHAPISTAVKAAIKNP